MGGLSHAFATETLPFGRVTNALQDTTVLPRVQHPRWILTSKLLNGLTDRPTERIVAQTSISKLNRELPTISKTHQL